MNDITTMNPKREITKFCRQLKRTLYGNCIPFTLTGSATTPSKYFELISLAYKGLCIRVSDHYCKQVRYNNKDIYSVVIKKIIDDQWIFNEIDKIKLWLDTNTKEEKLNGL